MSNILEESKGINTIGGAKSLRGQEVVKQRKIPGACKNALPIYPEKTFFLKLYISRILNQNITSL